MALKLQIVAPNQKYTPLFSVIGNKCVLSLFFLKLVEQFTSSMIVETLDSNQMFWSSNMQLSGKKKCHFRVSLTLK